MARSINDIFNKMKSDMQADPTLSPVLTSTSLTAIWRLIMQIFARAANLLEQVWDVYQSSLEQSAAQTPAGNPIWVQNQAFMYQYDPSGSSATNVLTILPGGALGYSTVDTTFRIVTRCAVVTDANNSVLIKVAQGDTSTGLSAISGTAFTQLDDYFTAKMPAGINHTVISDVGDKILVKGTVYFKPGYANSIKTNVEAAIKSYLDNIAISAVDSSTPVNYKGTVKVTEIIDAIKNTEGVDDFDLDILAGRRDSTLFANRTVFYDLANGINNREYEMYAGYGVQETTGGSTWSDLITYASA